MGKLLGLRARFILEACDGDDNIYADLDNEPIVEARSAHSGQEVRAVISSLDEYDASLDLYHITADDGWTGSAWRYEIHPVDTKATDKGLDRCLQLKRLRDR